MKAALLLLAAVLASGCGVRQESHEYRRSDRVAHLGVGFIAGTALDAGLRQVAPGLGRTARTVICVAAVAALGVGKEVYDSRHPDRHTADARDAIATTAGGVLAAGFRWEF
ncbi:MAG: hypothetical protein H0W48_00580 [Methylibium sp.]|nr:hypothetical protein [Methylibium sp.]